jgi:Galactose-3-O-sulfotransferase
LSGPADRRSRRDRCIIFLHIPKTGGVTLRRALKWKYSSSRMIYEETLTKPLEALEQVPLSERASALVVSGHLHYGVHEYIPRECEYVTVLREPVARVVSSYHYILGHPKHWLHTDLVGATDPLDEFLRIDPTVDNHQTRMVSGRGGGEIASRTAEPLGSEALEEAKRNLQRFLVVGLTERFDETFVLLRRALGWKLPYYVTANVATRPKQATERTLERIRERNRLDLELYEFADELLSAAIAEQGASFPREVAAFKAWNRVPNLAHRHVSGRARRVLQAALSR